MCLWHYVLQPKSFCLLFRRKLSRNIFIFFRCFRFSFSFFFLFGFFCSCSLAFFGNLLLFCVPTRMYSYANIGMSQATNDFVQWMFVKSSSFSLLLHLLRCHFGWKFWIPLGKSTEWSITKHDLFSLTVWHMFSCKLCCCMGNVKCQKKTRE